MKKCYIIGLLLSLNYSGFGQIVNIPDANFKDALLHTLCAGSYSETANRVVDTNGDGEIQLSEALSVIHLDVGARNISSLEGISAFSNLEELYCYNNNLTNLHLTGLANLYDLNCSNNSLTLLDVSESNIAGLDCAHNLLANIIWNPDNNPLYPLSVNMSYNLFMSIILPENTTHIDGMDFSGNPATSLVIPPISVADTYLNCSNMPNLIALENHSWSIYHGCYLLIQNNPNLQYINFRNNGREFGIVNEDPNDVNWWHTGNPIANCPALEAICIDELEMYAAYFYFGNSNVSLTSYCSFTPASAYNTVTGKIQFDTNGSGCNASSDPAVEIPLQIAYPSGEVMGATYTNTQGNYVSYSQYYQNLTLTPQFENPYFSISPPSYTSYFTNSGNTNEVNFCIAPNGTHPDLGVTLIPVTAARPGFDAKYKIAYKNKGTVIQSGTVTLNFNDAILDYVSSNPSGNSAAGSLSWNFTDLQPFEKREISFTLNVNSPAEIPAVNVGDLLTFTANVAAGVDETESDNTSNLTQTVTGSFDPNDKTVSILSTQVEPPLEYLTYTIRFQNTGNAAAENVVVADILDARFDKGSLQMVSASHPCTSRVTFDKLEVIFEGIDLPDAASNEPESHGYVTFKIKPLAGTVNPGDVIENTAGIYFDFNLPITTNTASTAYYSVLGTRNFDQSKVFTLYPNPVKNTVNLDISETTAVRSIGIYNTLGQLVQSVPASSEKMLSIDVAQLKTGTYFIEVTSNAGKTTGKFIKL